MSNRLSTLSRIGVAFASGALIVVFFLPAWRIDLFAPQYPEGLTLNIWVYKLSGDVDVINGLNHYIGMKPITAGMFPEFRLLPWVVGFFMFFGLIIAITGIRKYLFVYLLLSALGGILVFLDFYHWGYDYGHHLDPKAPIQVPGLSYQPPLLGHKRLLNFDAYSLPDVGGWVVLAAGSLAFAVWLAEWYHQRKPFGRKIFQKSPLLLCLPFFLLACNTKPEPFKPGRDNCFFCKMGISDTRFGGELITKKGKICKFDDLRCLVQFLRSGEEPQKNISQTFTVNFNRPNEFIDVNKSLFIISPGLRTPMSSQAAGFTNRQEALDFQKGKEAEIFSWQQLFAKLK